MICPNCIKEIKQNESTCPFCKEVIMQEVTENWKGEIEQVVLGYKEHASLAHGLQKDAIQNGWGHRLHTKGKDWRFVFKLVKREKDGYLLTMTDFGGHGLTGKNMKTEDIPDDLPESERLARFEHMYFSGGATQGAGLFGRGKLIFTAASKDMYIIYDSLTSNGIYRLNKRKLTGRKLENYVKAYEGEDAEHMLDELTDGELKPLKVSGTRITIVNPIDEVVKSINNGDLLKYIEETWWQIIQRYEGAKISIETDKKTEHAGIPKEFKDLPSSNTKEWKAKLIQPLNIDYEGESLKIKKVHFVVSPDPMPLETLGVYLYRREMKVANLELKNIPIEIEDKFYGFVELETNSDLENRYLEEKIEGPEHYSINKNNGLSRKLRKTVQFEFDKFKNEIGLGINSTKLAKEKTDRALREALAELHKRMSNLGISIGKVVLQKDIKIILEDIHLPSQNKVVNIGDEVENIKFRIENKSQRMHNLKIEIFTANQEGDVIESLLNNAIELKADENKILGALSFKIDQSLYPSKGEIFLSCVAKDAVANKTIASKATAIYIFERPSKILEPIEIDLEKAVFPRGHGNRRVNYGESIKNIAYTITNNLNEAVKIRFKIKILDAQTKTEVHSLSEVDTVLYPLKQTQIDCPELKVTKEIYSVLDRERGPVIIKATAVALEDSINNDFGKGDKLAKLDLRFWVNMDSGKGVFEGSRSWNGGPEEPRSEIQAEGQGYIFLLNETHPAYEVLMDNGDGAAINSYTYEQLLRQTLVLLLLLEKTEYWPDLPGKQYKNSIISDTTERHEIMKSCLNTMDYLYADYYSK